MPAKSTVEKLTATFSLKLTDRLKAGYDLMSDHEKFELQEKLRLEIARAIHNSKFNPKEYLEL